MTKVLAGCHSGKDFLPLTGQLCPCHAGNMDVYSSSSPPSRRASWIVRFARRVYHVCSEINRANKRASRLLLAYGLAESDRAPNTYAEFLLRSRATILHEPAARRRFVQDLSLIHI